MSQIDWIKFITEGSMYFFAGVGLAYLIDGVYSRRAKAYFEDDQETTEEHLPREDLQHLIAHEVNQRYGTTYEAYDIDGDMLQKIFNSEDQNKKYIELTGPNHCGMNYTSSKFDNFEFNTDMYDDFLNDRSLVRLNSTVSFRPFHVWRIEVGYHKGPINERGYPEFFMPCAMISTIKETYYIQGYDEKMIKFLMLIYKETQKANVNCRLWERFYLHDVNHKQLSDCLGYRDHNKSDCCKRCVHFRRRKFMDINIAYRLRVFTSDDYNSA
jgi:hypothetical protein